jgi:hypothetical protein
VRAPVPELDIEAGLGEVSPVGYFANKARECHAIVSFYSAF